ncbi:MAG: N-glycosylase/DNA lyase [Desulfurococcales archaeon]|nr:N-glycosylase/DNA lyase [Desulfurococcales archaeon]
MVLRPYELSYERIDRVAKAFNDVGIDGVLRIEVHVDPQYRYLKRLAEIAGVEAGVVYALLNAVVSYRLAMKGEDWWECFSSAISSKIRVRGKPSSVKEVVEDVIWFLNTCPGASVRRDAKIKRIRTIYRHARRLLEKLFEDPELVVRDPDYVIEKLARALQVESWRKTIVFSVKMAYYAFGGPEKGLYMKSTIPIPVDIRVSCVSYSSGVVKARSPEEVLRYPRTAQEAWGIVSRISGVPPLHLDSVIWVVGGVIRGKELLEARKSIVDLFTNVLELGDIVMLAEELAWRECP